MMLDQDTTVLLVNQESIPERIVRTFERFNCWVEVMALSHFALGVSVVEPDFIVCTQRLLRAVRRALAECESQARVIVVMEPNRPAPPKNRLKSPIVCALNHGAEATELAEFLSLRGVNQQGVQPPTIRPTSEENHVALRPITRSSGLSLVVRDSANPKRASQLCQFLSKAGHRVAVESDTADATSWNGLRWLAPHALVQHESDPCQDDGRWLGLFRCDPFLCTTPTITYSEYETWEQLLAGLAHLGRFESDLRIHLTPGREVAFDLSQVGACRLLHLLAEVGAHAQLSACNGSQVLRWGLVEGYVTDALLEHESRQGVGVDDALGWLLSYPDARIVLHLVRQLNVRPRASVQAVLGRAMVRIPPEAKRSSGVRARVVPPDAAAHDSTEPQARSWALVSPKRATNE